MVLQLTGFLRMDSGNTVFTEVLSSLLVISYLLQRHDAPVSLTTYCLHKVVDVDRKRKHRWRDETVNLLSNNVFDLVIDESQIVVDLSLKHRQSERVRNANSINLQKQGTLTKICFHQFVSVCDRKPSVSLLMRENIKYKSNQFYLCTPKSNSHCLNGLYNLYSEQYLLSLDPRSSEEKLHMLMEKTPHFNRVKNAMEETLRHIFTPISEAPFGKGGILRLCFLCSTTHQVHRLQKPLLSWKKIIY